MPSAASTWMERRGEEGGEGVEARRMYAVPALVKVKVKVTAKAKQLRMPEEPTVDWMDDNAEDFLSMPPPPPMLMRQNAVLSVGEFEMPKSNGNSWDARPEDGRRLDRPTQWTLRHHERSAVWSMPRGVQRLPP